MIISDEQLKNLSSTEYGIEIFGTLDNYKMWLDKENFYFDRKKPSEFLSNDKDLDFLESNLIGMIYGDNA